MNSNIDTIRSVDENEIPLSESIEHKRSSDDYFDGKVISDNKESNNRQNDIKRDNADLESVLTVDRINFFPERDRSSDTPSNSMGRNRSGKSAYRGSFRLGPVISGHEADTFRSIDSSTSGSTFSSFQDINLTGVPALTGIDSSTPAEVPPEIRGRPQLALPVEGIPDAVFPQSCTKFPGKDNDDNVSNGTDLPEYTPSPMHHININSDKMNGSHNEKYPNKNMDTNDPEKVGTFRTLFPQILAVLAKNTLGLNLGLSIGFQTIAIPALSKQNPDLYMTPDEISWFGSLFFIAIPFGCIFSGPSIHYWGRKLVMCLFCIPFYGAWWIYIYANSTTMMYIGVLFHGFINGLLEAPILTYVAEVSQPKWRGMLASTSVVFTLSGILLQFLIGNHVTWRKAALINSVFPIISFVTICMVPESPHWLVSQGKMEKAEASLKWLRGWVPSSHVKQELEELIQEHSASNDGNQRKSVSNWRLYLKGSFLKPFMLVFTTFIIGHFSGMATIQTYSVSIFESFGVGSGYQWTAAMGATQVAGATLCVVILPWVGKRPISILSMIGVTVGLTVAASVGKGLWAAVFLLLANFCTNSCSRVVPWILIGEVFPHELRAIASGLASCCAFILGFVVSRMYKDMINWLTLQGNLGFYAGVGFCGLIFYYFLLPETEGKSLNEVQKFYSKKVKDGAVNKAFVPDAT